MEEHSPKRLVRFSKCDDFLLASLMNHTVYFNSVENLNDPFEGIFRFKVTDYNYKKFSDFYLKRYVGDPRRLDYYYENKNEFEKLLNRGFDWRYKNNGICCFSDELTVNDPIMWATYADKNCGVCLVFETEKLMFIPVDRITDRGEYVGGAFKLYKVNYTNSYIDEDPYKSELNQNSFLTTKFIKWEYEHEYRYIGAQPGNHFFPKDCLVEVIFGLRTPEEKKWKIKYLIIENYPHVKVKEVILERSKFHLKVIEN